MLELLWQLGWVRLQDKVDVIYFQLSKSNPVQINPTKSYSSFQTRIKHIFWGIYSKSKSDFLKIFLRLSSFVLYSYSLFGTINLIPQATHMFHDEITCDRQTKDSSVGIGDWSNIVQIKKMA